MAITTLDGVLAGALPPVTFMKAATPTLVAGRPHSLFYLAGMPGAAVAPTPGLAGAALTSYAGQLPFSNPPSGNSYLARLQAQATIAGTLSATWTSGAASLVAYCELARLELTAANVPAAIDAVTSGFPRLFGNTVLFLIFTPSTTTASNIAGQLVVTQG